MKKSIILICLALFLTGCNFLPTRTVYEEYPVPVYKVPAPPEIDRPYLPIYDLAPMDKENTDKVIRAYIISVRLLLNYATAQEEILETYKRLSESTTSENRRVLSLSRAAPNTNRPLSKLEAEKLISTAEKQEEEAVKSFNTIVDNYQRNKQDIWREFNELRTN